MARSAGQAGRRARRQVGRQREGGSRAIFTWDYRAVRDGAALPHQDRWRGRTCHVTGQRPGRRHVIPLAASLAREIGAGKSVSFGEKIVLDLKLVYKKC